MMQPLWELSMNYILLNAFLAVAPAVILLFWFNRRDTRRPEPGRLIFSAVGLGILSTLPAIVLEMLVDPLFTGLPPLEYALATGFITAALVEESCKLFFVYRFLFRKPQFDEVSDGIIYTIAASMGFALFENILYSQGVPGWTLLLRGFTAVPLHALASGIMGYYIGRAKFGRPSLRFKGLAAAVLIHGAYDFFLFTGTWLAFLTIPLLLISWRKLKQLSQLALTEDRFYGRS